MTGGDDPGAAGDGLSYAEAGVDLDAADEAVARLGPHVERTTRPEVLGGLGGFGGLVEVPRGYRQPVLVAATDGVGTKLEVARALGRHDTIGIDLVAMVADDVVVAGAEPLLFLDYLAVERLDPGEVEQIVAGIADGCELAGCALVGGEIAEHRGVLRTGSYDVAGFGVGVVERKHILGPDRVGVGDQLVAMASSGLHANGYALARRIVADLDWSAPFEPAGTQTLGDALLRPTRIYARDCLALARAGGLRALCHVTGGGIPGNLPRVLPEGLGALVDTATFAVPGIFAHLADRGGVDAAEMWRVFNMGAGMIAVVADGRAAVDLLAQRGVDAWQCGEVTDGGGVRLVGLHG